MSTSACEDSQESLAGCHGSHTIVPWAFFVKLWRASLQPRAVPGYTMRVAAPLQGALLPPDWTRCGLDGPNAAPFRDVRDALSTRLPTMLLLVSPESGLTSHGGRGRQRGMAEGSRFSLHGTSGLSRASSPGTISAIAVGGGPKRWCG